MPEIPRDPRQLARDILSGKIKLEDLARERQRQQGGVVPPPNAPPRPRADAPIPLPRPPQAQPPIPPPQPARPVARPPVSPPKPPKQKAPKVRQFPAGTPVTVPPRQTPASPAANPNALPPSQEPYGEAAQVQSAARPKPLARDRTVRTMVKDRQSLRQAVVLAEILNKPLALRDDPPF
jgi:hypothetical protein